MRDPFRPNTKSQLVREAQVGLSVVAILLSLFIYVAFYRITGRGRQIPDHIRNGPVAKSSSSLGSSHDELKSLLEKIAEERDATASKLGRLPAVDRPMDPSLSSIDSAVGNRDPSFQASAESYNQLASASVAIEPELNREPAQSRTRDTSKRRSKTSIAGQLNSFLSGYGSQPKPSDSRTKEIVATTAMPKPQAEGGFSPKRSTPEGLSNRIPDRETNSGSASRISQPPRERNSLGASPASQPRPAPPVSLTRSEESDFVPRSTSPHNPALGSVSARHLGMGPFESTGRGNLGSHLEKLPSIRPPMPDLYAPASIVQRIPRLAQGDDRPGQAKLDSVPVSRIEVVTGVPPVEQIEPAREFANSEYRPDHAATYMVRGDESLYTVAQAIYQDGKYFRALYKQNEELIEQAHGKLTGLRLDTPPRGELRSRWPGMVPENEASILGEQGSAAHESTHQFYTTQVGDTLFDISRRKLNQASRYLEIYTMNQRRLDAQTDPYSELPAGINLILPRL